MPTLFSLWVDKCRSLLPSYFSHGPRSYVMTKQEAHYLLFQDAVLSRKEENLSVSEWEERITEEPLLRDASDLAGQTVIDAITCFVWGWDRFV